MQFLSNILLKYYEIHMKKNQNAMIVINYEIYSSTIIRLNMYLAKSKTNHTYNSPPFYLVRCV